MDVRVSLGAEAIDATLQEQKLAKDSDGKHDMDEDGRRVCV